MTEAEWLASEDPGAMLMHLDLQGVAASGGSAARPASVRSRRSLICRCSSRVRHRHGAMPSTMWSFSR